MRLHLFFAIAVIILALAVIPAGAQYYREWNDFGVRIGPHGYLSVSTDRHSDGRWSVDRDLYLRINGTRLSLSNYADQHGNWSRRILSTYGHGYDFRFGREDYVPSWSERDRWRYEPYRSYGYNYDPYYDQYRYEPPIYPPPRDPIYRQVEYDPQPRQVEVYYRRSDGSTYSGTISHGGGMPDTRPRH